jgi:uncharacterized integral membrane protein
MRFLVWLLRIVVFVALFGLAIKNSGLVELRFYFGNIWQSPLSLVILGSFVAGVIMGITAGFATMIRQRRENSRLKEQLRAQTIAANSPPMPRAASAAAEMATPPLNLI